MDDPSLDEIQARLSAPAAAIPGQVPRRRFLQGALAAGAGAFLVPSWAGHLAAAATPIGAHDGVLLVLQLGGGNDGLSMVPPLSGHADYARYHDARGANMTVKDAVPLAQGLGLHPELPKLKSRWDAGEVAIVRGVGHTVNDLSHFSSTETWMAGTAGNDRTTGWLGRWLDGVPEATAGLRGVSVGSDVPLHVRGARAQVTSLSAGLMPFGSDHFHDWYQPMYDAVTAMAEGTTGKGRLADLSAGSKARSIALAEQVAPVVGSDLPDGELVPNLTLAAKLINADLGIRVLTCTHRDYDLHRGLTYGYAQIMAELDEAVEAFFTTLAPAFRDRVAMMTFSEFGRRVSANGSDGTGHGTAAPQLVIGSKVKGGFYGAQPRLDDLDSRGNLKVTVDLRSYYASIVDGWLAGGSSTVLRGSYEDLDLFRTAPGGRSTPPPPVDPTWQPFPDPATLVRQQYLDFLGRPADDAGVTYWVNRLTSGSTIPWTIDAFLSSKEFGQAVAPAIRLTLSCLGDPYHYDDLMAWAARVRNREPLATIADDVTRNPAFAARYGSLSDHDFVERAHLDATGTSAPGSFTTTWVGRLAARSATRAELMATLVEMPATATHLRVQVDVTMTYAGLLRRSPDPGGYAFWCAKGEAGTSIQRLIAYFFASAEYRGRFS